MARRTNGDAQDRARLTILRAAEQVFAAKGFSAAKVAEIAVEAGYTAPALYKYFNGKQAIFEALLEQALGHVQYAADTLPAVRKGALEAEVDALFDATFAMLEGHARTFLTLAALQASGEVVPGRALVRRETETLQRVRTLIGERLRDAVGKRSSSMLDAAEAATFFDALCLGLFLRWAPTKVYGRGASFRQHLPMAKKAFLRGIGAPSSPRKASVRAIR